MADLTLSAREQIAMRALLASEPVAGAPVPDRDFLENLAELVPGDALGAVVARNNGQIADFRAAPGGYYDRFRDGEEHGDSPFLVGVMHWSRMPEQAAACDAMLPGHVDGISVGFRSGADAVAQVFWDRRKRPFSDRDLAMLDLLMPVLQRHLRQAHTPHLPKSLSVQERRVMMRVANGLSNAEVAASLFLSPSTVSKHLENCYRKLGVTNRLAAVRVFEGRDLVAEHADRGAKIGRVAELA
jgi:DNA-binding CsgD family transcriptional regulator